MLNMLNKMLFNKSFLNSVLQMIHSAHTANFRKAWLPPDDIANIRNNRWSHAATTTKGGLKSESRGVIFKLPKNVTV